MNLPLYALNDEGSKMRSFTIKREIIDCYASIELQGKFRIQLLHNHQDVIHVILILPYVKQFPFLEIHFPQNFPSQSLEIQLHIYNDQTILQSQVYTVKQQNIKLKDIIHQTYQHIQNTPQQNTQKTHSFGDFSKEAITKVTASTETLVVKDQQFGECSSPQKQSQLNQKTLKKRKLKKQVSMASNVEKELTETKNLNRHFRSKLRQVYKDLMLTQKASTTDSLYIQQVFSPNRVGFEDIRKALKNNWFNGAVKRQMSTGRFLHKILRGMMSVKSKRLMIKYYHVMASAVQNPDGFIRWKYQ